MTIMRSSLLFAWAALLASSVPAPLFGKASVAEKLSRYPLVAQQSLADSYVRDNAGSKGPEMYARYSAMLVAAGGLNRDSVPFWKQVLQLNPSLLLAVQWPVPSQGCAPTVNLAAFEAYFASLGDFKDQIDAVELDGTGNFAIACGQAALTRAVQDFRAALQRNGVAPMLTMNGASFPQDEPDCGYEARLGTGGGRAPALPELLNGSLEEGWISRSMARGNMRRALARVGEACSWIKHAAKPSLVWAFDETPTPWWTPNEARPSARWSNLRLGFAAAQMYDRVIYIYNPTKQGVSDRGVNPERLFWSDYFAVDLRTGRPPGYGASTIGSQDDDLAGQRAANGYLGSPTGPARAEPASGGVVFAREFQCGFVYANFSPADYRAAPAVATRRIKGIQDPGYDDGSARAAYTLPSADGLILLKQSCLSI